jgi:MFS family permease
LKASRYAVYVLIVMTGINLLNYMDRYVGSATAPLIQREFRLSDAAVGLLGTAFLLVYAVTTVPFGYWADRGVRKVVIGTGVTIWSLATVVTGLTRNFVQLFTTRALLGIGEAAYYPAGTALLGDYFPKASRGRANAIWNSGTAMGIALGFGGGGAIAQAYGWRTAFFLTAVPGLVFAVLAFAMREPKRGQAEPRGPELERARDASLRNFANLLRIPTLRATIFSQALLYFVLAANAYWLPTALNRRFGLSIAAAGLLSGIVLVAGGLVGSLVGGFVSDHLARRDLRGHLRVAIAGFVVAAFTITVALVAPFSFSGVPVFLPAFFVTVVGLYLWQAPFTTISQNVVAPSLRASAVTTTLLIAHVLGDSHAPFVVGIISDRVGSLQTALLIVSPTLLLAAALVAGLGLPSIRRDTEKMEDAWAMKERDPEAAVVPTG